MSVEYTTSLLISNTLADLAALDNPPWSTGAVRNANGETSTTSASTNAYRQLSADETSVTLRRVVYQIGFLLPKGEVRTIEWEEKFAPTGGGTIVSTKKSIQVVGTGVLQHSVHTLNPPEANGSIYVVVPGSSCSAGVCGMGTGSVAGGDGGSALTFEDDGVFATINLGTSGAGSLAGQIIITGQGGSASLGTPQQISVAAGPQVKRIFSAGALSQIEFPDGLAVVTDTSAGNVKSFKIEFFSNPGTWQGDHYTGYSGLTKTWTISNLGSVNTLQITDPNGMVNDFTWAPGSRAWSLVEGSSVRYSRNTWTDNTRVREVREGSENGTLLYQEQSVYLSVTNAQNEVVTFLTQQIVGTGNAARTNIFVPITDTNSPNFGQLLWNIDSQGGWRRFSYDTNQRVVQTISGFINAGTNDYSNTNLCRVWVYDYTSLATNDNLVLSPGEPRTASEYVLGNLVSRSFAIISAGERRDIRAWSALAEWDDTNNQVSISREYSVTNGNSTNVVWLLNYYGTLRIACSSTNSQGLRQELSLAGSPDATGTNVLDGTRTTTIYNEQNAPTSRTTVVVTNGVAGSAIASEEYTYGDGDNPHRVTRVDNLLDGTFTTSTYDTCCGLQNTRDREGIYTYYYQDALKRQTATKRADITHSNLLDAAGNVLQELRIGTNSTQQTIANHVYDAAGQLVATTDALNNPTSYTNYSDGTYWVKKTTFPDLSERIERYYRDGQLYEVTGSATLGVRHEYGADTGGTHTITYVLATNGTPTSEWTKTYTDILGRVYKTEFAAASAPYPARLSFYNNLGQLIITVEPNGTTNLFFYNALGEMAASVVDMNGNGSSDEGDRITSYGRSYWSIDGHLAEVRSTTNAVGVVSETATAVDALIAWQISAGLTNTTVTVLDGNGGRTVTTTAPDGTSTVSTYANGSPTAMTRSAGATQLAGLTFAFDEFGRQQTITDARADTTTTLAYDAADRVTNSTVAASGLTSQSTTNYFDSMGRVWKTVLPDSGAVTNEFYANGLRKKTYGAREYPVEFEYDLQGRMTTMRTWTNYPSGGVATNTWKYDGYRGFMTNKVYQGGTGPKYFFTASGQLQTRISDSGYSTNTYSWNSAGELAGISYGSLSGLYEATASLVLGRDALGRVTNAAHGASFTNQLTYTDAGQVATESHGAWAGITVSNHFNSLRQRDGLAVSGVSGVPAVTYSFDVSRLASVSFSNVTVEYLFWPKSSLLSNVIFKSSGTERMTTSRNYDGFDRLAGISSAPSAASAVSFNYGYNAANQRSAFTNADSSRWAFGYDSLGQVTNGYRFWSDGSPVAGQKYEYQFDTIGNRRLVRSGGDTNGANLRESTYTVNLLNQVTGRSSPGYVSIVGDADTNATVKVNGVPAARQGRYYSADIPVSSVWVGVTNVAVASTNSSSETYTRQTNGLTVNMGSTTLFEGNPFTDGRWSYRFDAENRLAKMMAASAGGGYPYQHIYFSNDWMSRRISKVVSNRVGSTWYLETARRFVYDQWNLVAELDGGNAVQRTHIWGLDASGTMQGAGGVGGLLATIIHTGTNAGVYFPAYDGNHNVVAYVSASTGEVVAEYEYGPFHELIRATGPLAKEFNFLAATKYYDWETGLYYYGHRYYTPSSGRWLSRDPIQEQGGINLYSFCYNEPVASYDTDGRYVFTDNGLYDYRIAGDRFVFNNVMSQRQYDAYSLDLVNALQALARNCANIYLEPVKPIKRHVTTASGFEKDIAFTMYQIKYSEENPNCSGDCVWLSLKKILDDKNRNVTFYKPSWQFRALARGDTYNDKGDGDVFVSNDYVSRLPQERIKNGDVTYPRVEVPLGVVIYHELVGHVELDYKHAQEPINTTAGWKQWYIDDTIQVENTARSALGIPNRRPWYFDRLP